MLRRSLPLNGRPPPALCVSVMSCKMRPNGRQHVEQLQGHAHAHCKYQVQHMQLRQCYCSNRTARTAAATSELQARLLDHMNALAMVYR